MLALLPSILDISTPSTLGGIFRRIESFILINFDLTGGGTDFCYSPMPQEHGCLDGMGLDSVMRRIKYAVFGW